MNPAHVDLRRGRAALGLAAAILVAGCSAAGSLSTPTPTGAASLTAAPSAPPAGRPSDLPVQTPPLATVPPSAEPVLGEAPAEVVAAARDDLAERIGSEAASAAVVLRSEAVTWPNGSLDCPRPGIYYQPIEVEGFQVVFDVDGTQYDYRTTGGGNVLACDRGGPHP